MNRYIALAIVLGAIFFAVWSSGGSIGVSSQCENTKCVVSASTSPISIFLASALLVFLFLYKQKIIEFDQANIVGIWRRCGAFFLDFVFLITVFGSLAAIPILIAEATFTGQFQWSFEREFSRPSDSTYMVPSIFLVFLSLYYYFYKHGQKGRPTIGQYVLNYTVVCAKTGVPQYGKRVLFAYVGLCVWPISVVLALRKPDKVFWWDSATNTTVARISAVNKAIQFAPAAPDRRTAGR